MRIKLILALSLLITASACKAPRKAAADAPKPPEIINDDDFRKPVIDKQLYTATTESVPLDTIYITKDTLHILTRKIQGCDAENFKLVWNGAMAKSLPPQTKVKLFQLTDASCKERHQFNLQYNLAPLRYKQDSVSKKVTIVSLGGWKESLKYEF